MALLVAGTILNVHDALNEFGVLDISASTGYGTDRRRHRISYRNRKAGTSISRMSY
ncbi:hypothetical protein [Bacteroides acidifaciens]|uniref:hypothetical protein n=1 Tax=Bacteroides acidifaciens TaxID=85831 RepID=UPI002430BC09|nr:hypothetical protein [Bacteroides acidifaciens]